MATMSDGKNYKIDGDVNQISLIRKIREMSVNSDGHSISLREAKNLYRAMMVFQCNNIPTEHI